MRVDAHGARRLAMWSGPRNISTAMLRSFGNRADAVVVDEPLYAHYLEVTGLEHPGREEVLAHHERDWRQVVDALLAPLPEGKTLSYQKHMAHHLLPGVGRDWLGSLDHAFLLRDPREMLLSLAKVLPAPRIEDTGLPQQVELFEELRAAGATPPVLDARDVLEDPRGQLGALCDSLDLAFDEAMLSWPAGPRATDGVWARHWYASVEASTEFARWSPREGELAPGLGPVLDACKDLHSRLHAHRLRP